MALVVAFTALSSGLDDAQAEVLDPLTGVGTEMSVARPLAAPDPSAQGDPSQGLSEREQKLSISKGLPRKLQGWFLMICGWERAKRGQAPR